MSFIIGPAIDFGPFRRVVSIDPATTAGVVIADIWRSDRDGAVDSPTLDAMDEQHAIALIAANFADDLPSTPHRAALFAMKLDVEPRG